MQNRITLVALVALLLTVSVGCRPDTTHEEEVEAWYARRVEGLTAPDGWLSLTGLFWLEEGANTFGGADTNALVFPGANLPDYLGTFILQGDSVTARLAPGSGVTHSGGSAEPFGVLTDAYEEPTMFERGSLRWYVIDREGRLGIRLMDEQAEARRAFKGTERYPLSEAWRVQGRFIPYDPPHAMEVPTEINATATLTSPGAVEFEVEGQTHRLDVVGEPGDDRLWIIFADPTNKSTTYPAGRYLYIDAADEAGNVVIDFNQSYSPPCAFSAYATCPFPPPQNRLTVPVEAGEKRYEGPVNA